jgi:hypothetical protein|tara:strand:+ start:119 stop:292 length:174 start_codon:yes stop_codon:yes gene_type:complete
MKKKTNKNKTYLIQVTTNGNKAEVTQAMEVTSKGYVPADKRQVTRQVLNKASTFVTK